MAALHFFIELVVASSVCRIQTTTATPKEALAQRGWLYKQGPSGCMQQNRVQSDGDHRPGHDSLEPWQLHGRMVHNCAGAAHRGSYVQANEQHTWQP